MSASRKRITAITIATVVALAIGGGAFAYWTLSGSGTGSATTDTVSGSITVNQTSTVTDLRPGGAPQTLSGDFNNSDASPIFVTSVTVSISSVTSTAGTCAAGDYTLTGAVMTVNDEVDPGIGVGSWGGATIAFNNLAENQDDCQGATVNLAYTAS